MTPTACQSERTGIAVPRDPQLPQLAMALDVNRMAPLLPFPDSVSGHDIRVAYVRYKPRTNCIVLYEVLQEDGSALWAYAKLFSQALSEKVSDNPAIASYHPEHRMVLLRFPCDLEMPSLGMATSPGEAHQLLARVAGSRKEPWFWECWGRWTPVRYKPERRCVMRGTYQDPKGPRLRGFYARFYSAHEGVNTPLWHRHFKRLKDKKVRVARFLASSSGRRALFVAEQEGDPLRAFFTRPDSDLKQAVHTTAHALANWHRLTPPPAAMPLDSDAGPLRAAAETLNELLADSELGASELAEELVRNAPQARGTRLLHGDFYYDQVILSGKRAYFLDLDELGLGDPARDVANFCAHTKLVELRGELPSSRARAVCEWFIEAYQSAAGDPIPQQSLAWHLSTSLLSLAVLPFRTARPEWPQRMKLILEQARMAATRERGVRC